MSANSSTLNNLPSLPTSPKFGDEDAETVPPKRLHPLIKIGALAAAVAAVTFIGWRVYARFIGSSAVRAELLVHTVKRSNLDLTIVERGTLESADNRDIICRVKAGSKGSFASTIKWVIDDGTMVRKGQMLMMLDSSSLEDQYRSQKIAVEQSQSALVAAEQAYRIQVSQNESEIETARIAIQLAELDLEKYVGLPKGTLHRLERLKARGLLTEMETDLESFLVRHKDDFPDAEGEYQQSIDDISGRIELAIAEHQMLKDRFDYSRRMQQKGFLSAAQVQADESRLASSQESLKKVRNEKQILLKFTSQRNVKDFSAKVQEAWRAFDRVVSQAHAKEVEAEAKRRTQRSIFLQEEEKLHDIEDQLHECKIHAPQDGMVVYYIPESSRWSSSERGLIQQGASVQEGQKLMRIPDLRRMQVTTRVHEAMVTRVRGDDRRTTGVHESVRAALLWSPDAITRLVSCQEEVVELFRGKYHDQEFRLASAGQPSTIRLDAFRDRTFKGHVKSVATVASSADFMTSDVKVYQTVVSIDDSVPGLKPGMSAEVTIHIDNTLENVITVPIQSIVGGAESGSTRKVIVITPDGTAERDVVIGLSNEKMVEIRDGLKEGDLIVLNPKVIVGDKAKTREETQDKSGKGGGNRGKGGPPGGGGSGAPGGGGTPGGKKS